MKLYIVIRELPDWSERYDSVWESEELAQKHVDDNGMTSYSIIETELNSVY